MENPRFTQTLYRFLAILPFCAALLLCACEGASSAASGENADPVANFPLTAEKALPAVSFDPGSIPMPEASGENVQTGGGVTLDASNTDDGYVMVASEPNEKAVVTRVAGDSNTYHYRQPTDNSYETYPLQMGDGAYSVQAFEQVEGDRYARVFATDIDVALTSELSPFLYPNQYVPYAPEDAAVSASFSIAQGLSGDAAVADALYRYVRDSISYDYEKAATVQEGYLPVPDETLATKKGICFDYAALLAAMLRVQGIPARLVIGHVAPDNLYHAWNEAYVDGRWVFFDPTLARENRDIKNYQPERIY